MSISETQVRKRRVFYIPGFDPHPPRRYRELYRSEGQKQAEISRYRLAVRKGPKHTWEVASEVEDARVRAGFEVLEWSDIVQETMDRSLGGTYLQLLRVVWIYVSTGTLQRLMWLGKGPIIAAFYPVLGLLMQLFVSLLLGWVLGSIVAGLVGWGVSQLISGLSFGWLRWLVALPVAWLVLKWFKSRDGRLFIHYLMHDFAYTAKARGAYPDALQARIESFATRVEKAMASDVDEVLVVGHSSGAALAVSVLAEVLRRGRVQETGPALSLLTLGQAIPMMSFLPQAKTLRRDLQELSTEDRITWVDVSAPGDGCCFALSDPVAVSGIAPDGGHRWPLVLSAAFTQTLSEQTRAALKRRFFRLHFQYLCAFDSAESYDYFRITAGPFTLGARFADRNPSANRIDVAASRYRSMAA